MALLKNPHVCTHAHTSFLKPRSLLFLAAVQITFVFVFVSRFNHIPTWLLICAYFLIKTRSFKLVCVVVKPCQQISGW